MSSTRLDNSIKVRDKTLFEKISKRVFTPIGLVFLISIVCVGFFESYIYQKNSTETLNKLKFDLGHSLLNTAKLAALSISPTDHVEVFSSSDYELPEFVRMRDSLRNIKKEVDLKEEIYTLRIDEEDHKKANFIVMSGDTPYIGRAYTIPDSMLPVFTKGQAIYTDVYLSSSDEKKRWMSAFAPIEEPDSEFYAVLEIDISVEEVLSTHDKDMATLRLILVLRTLFFLILFGLTYYLFSRILNKGMDLLVDKPLNIIGKFVYRVGEGDLDGKLDINSGDEFEVLGNSMNHMVVGLKAKRAMSRFLTDMTLKEVDEISQGKEHSLSGSKKLVTTLFSDIRGFTTISENYDPSVVVDALNFYFENVLPIIDKYGGSLDKIIGDAVMAVFITTYDEGGEIVLNGADSAVKASLEMQKKLDQIRSEMVSKNMPEFFVGYGLNTGEAIVGNVGTQQVMSRTVFGDSVNLAARVESLSKEGKSSKILITEYTQQAMTINIENSFLMETIVKGKSYPVKIYELDAAELDKVE
ncbi:MAG: adenylate/guanylate cyclase domain-containing protein [Candidatus Cloacimonetes bacterium]|nr:adenylate/guanylate cyclase domain-containing protein [Candidatus Cloacimonadota bacterium]